MVNGKLIEVRPGMKIVNPREQKLPRARDTEEINATVIAIINNFSKNKGKSHE